MLEKCTLNSPQENTCKEQEYKMSDSNCFLLSKPKTQLLLTVAYDPKHVV